MITETPPMPMEVCPVCHARYAGKDKCHRCGADLKKLVEILHCAEVHTQKAWEAWGENEPEQMCYHAGRAAALKQSLSGLKTLAVASLLNYKFETAVRLWFRIQMEKDHGEN